MADWGNSFGRGNFSRLKTVFGLEASQVAAIAHDAAPVMRLQNQPATEKATPPKTVAELQAEALDNGDLEDYYERDERHSWIFDRLHYDQEQREWIARFIPASPASVPYFEASHARIIGMITLLHIGRIKPSQSFKAHRTFEAMIDREVSKLNYTHDL